jgi:hypothetical protein
MFLKLNSFAKNEPCIAMADIVNIDLTAAIIGI